MYQVDRNAILDGISSLTLMKNAGKKIAQICERVASENLLKKVLILCGPGNNGGDGYFAAYFLRKKSIFVDIYSSHSIKNLKLDARKAYKTYHKSVKTELTKAEINEYDLIVDAVFGAGLSRPLPKALIAMLKYIKKRKIYNID